jgi:hypothetical protein
MGRAGIWPGKIFEDTKMTMKFSAMLLTGALALSACGEESCTTETAQKKMADVTAKATAVMTADPTKAADLTKRMQDITTQIAAGGDLEAVCKGLDDMMAELSK